MAVDLVLRVNNLYRNGEIIAFDNGELALTRSQLEIEGTLQDEYYTVLAKDELTLIAYNKYNKFVEDASKFWWVIADANSINNPLDLSDLVGQEILIPNIITTLLSLE